MADMIDSFLQLSRTTQGELAVRRVNLSEHVAHIVQKLRDRDPLAEEDDDYFIPQASIHFGKRCLYHQNANLALLCAGLMIDRVLTGDVL